MDEQILQALAIRLGPEHAKKRLAAEDQHTARILGHGLNFFHIENWYSVHSFIGYCLRLVGLYHRGKINACNIELKENKLSFANLPAEFDGFKILHLSDLHLDMHPAATHALIEKLMSVDYDLCVLTGDYRARTYGDITSTVDAMRQVRAQLKDPIYAVLGNHDSIRMLPDFEAMGIKLLLNENITFTRGDSSIFLAGIDDAHYFRVDDIIKAAVGIKSEQTSILLSHTPEVYQQAAEAGFDAFLCGHTHGGQICLPGGIPVTLDSNCPRFVGKGAWCYQNMQGYTSVGSGTSVVNVRINCLPEITLHTLRTSASN